jgi:heterodisulfide reductase subunit A
MSLVRPLTRPVSSRVVVVGGGIAGLEAALNLARVGLPVTLVESGPSLGGLMAQLDKTFPTNDCAMCILAPRLLEASRHPLIDIRTLTRVVGVEGAAGNFRVILARRPRYVDPARCTGCGECTRVCPRRIPDPFNLGQKLTKAIHVPFPQAVPQAAYITPEACRHLQGHREAACVRVCLAGAVNFDDRPEFQVLEAGAVLLAPGLVPAPEAEFPGSGHPDVVSSLVFERLLSATGPFGGKLLRPSDRREPRSICFIHCVGSRDQTRGAAYCSSFCCLASLKEALVAQELTDGRTASTLFYMDLRAQGKDQERYLEEARGRGVELVRSRVTAVQPAPAGGVSVRYTDSGGRARERHFDLAVLALGLRPPAHFREWARELGLPLNSQGFIATRTPVSHQTAREGVFVAGAAREPTDISQTVTAAAAAAQGAAQLLAACPRPAPAPVRGLPGRPPEPLRLGVFICHCGTNIARTVDPEALAQLAAALPQVAWVEHFLFSCSADATQKMAEIIRSQGLNRVVVAACSPRTHEAVFREVLVQAGLNPGYLAFTNIREQCAWVHQDNPAAALAKARDLVAMAAARAAVLKPILAQGYPVIPRALVLGGGVAGLSAALSLADQGFHTYVVERAPVLGGTARRLHTTLEGFDPRLFLQDLEKAVYQHPNVEVLLQAELTALSGAVGRFRSRVQQHKGGRRRERILEHGIVVAATGGGEMVPRGRYGYGEDPRILTQLELEEKIALEDDELHRARRLIMIQCVGSREPEHPYCSRLCCAEALKNALHLKQRHPALEIVILYRDLRAYGFKELAYQEAKGRGVRFLPFDPARPPQVEIKRRRPLTVRLWDDLLQQELALTADLLVLSAGISPAPGYEDVARLLKVPLGTGGFLQEAHIKLKPVDTVVEGVFICGLAQYPQTLGEAVAQAQAAALRGAAVLHQVELPRGEISAEVDRTACRRCLTCLRICPFDAIRLTAGGVPEVVGESCRGCGLCAAACPAEAVRLSRCTDSEIWAQIQAFLEEQRGEEYGERELLRSVR